MGEVRSRLRNQDISMVAQYARRPGLSPIDNRTILTPGCKVIMRQRQPGKMKLKATGPYTFLRFVGRQGLGAELMDQGGHTLRASLSNVLPCRG